MEYNAALHHNENEKKNIPSNNLGETYKQNIGWRNETQTVHTRDSLCVRYKWGDIEQLC